MARIWKEERKGHWSQHFDLHAYVGLPAHDVSPNPALIPVWTYCVEVCGFTFRFGSVAQIKPVWEYYQQKLRPSSRLDTTEHGFERDVSQRWFERLPGHLLKESRRLKVIKALQAAMVEFGEYLNRFPTESSCASNLPVVRRES